MKNTITIALLLISVFTFSQTNFKWEKIDSVKKNKAEIYSDTKLFVAQQWKSSKDVIQNDDKESGTILIKGVVFKSKTFMMATYDYLYNYTVTFQMKDNKYRIIISDVYCDKVLCTSGNGQIRTLKNIEPFDGENCPETGTMSTPGLPKAKMISLMAEVKEELQMIYNSYLNQITKTSANSEW